MDCYVALCIKISAEKGGGEKYIFKNELPSSNGAKNALSISFSRGTLGVVAVCQRPNNPLKPGASIGLIGG